MHITEDRLTFDLQDGRVVSVPLAFYPTLMNSTQAERNEYEITHSSVYWPKLDCDLSSECLLQGKREARKYAEKSLRS